MPKPAMEEMFSNEKNAMFKDPQLLQRTKKLVPHENRETNVNSIAIIVWINMDGSGIGMHIAQISTYTQTYHV